MNRGTARFGLLVIWLIAIPAIAQGTLESCRKLTDPAARLACYDALSLTPPGSPPPVHEPGPKRTSETQRVGEATVQSTVSGDFSGWGPNETIALENGQGLAGCGWIELRHANWQTHSCSPTRPARCLLS